MANIVWTKARRKELALRLISAAFLIPFALYVVWAGGAISAAGSALFAVIMAYEWVRMTSSPSMKILVALAFVPASVAFFAGILAGTGALLVCAIVAGLSHPVASERIKSGLGLLYTTGMPLALYALREGDWNGQAAALLLMVIVWASDSGAFFTGRTFGGPSLSSISPSKTWSGAFGGVAFSMLGGVLAAFMIGGDWAAWMLAGALISVAAQVGDMFESVLKRRLGVKDASDLLPGHGGVMDRVDGLGAAAFLGVIVLALSSAVAAALGIAG